MLYFLASGFLLTPNKKHWQENRMVEEYVDVEYISLHGYVRSTPSDTEVHAEHQLRVNRSTWPVEKNIQNHAKLIRMKELGGKKQEC